MEYMAYILAGITIIGALVALFRWVSKVDENTRATERLTAAFEQFTKDFAQKLFDHEKRIARLEGVRHAQETREEA